MKSMTRRTRPSCFPSSGSRACSPYGSSRAKCGSTDAARPLPRRRCPTARRSLFLRPHDVDVVDNASGAIVGQVCVLRRHAGLRRVELEVGLKRNRDRDRASRRFQPQSCEPGRIYPPRATGFTRLHRRSRADRLGPPQGPCSSHSQRVLRRFPADRALGLRTGRPRPAKLALDLGLALRSCPSSPSWRRACSYRCRCRPASSTCRPASWP